MSGLYRILHKIIDKGTYVSDSYSTTGSIGKDSYQDFDFTITKNGYYPIGIIGYSFTGSGSTTVYPSRLFINTATEGRADVVLRARNTSTQSAASPTIQLRILWQKVGGVVSRLLSEIVNTSYMRGGVCYE